MGSQITAIGTANPENKFSQHCILEFMINAHELAGTSADRLTKIYSISGINTRYSVLKDFGMAPGQYAFFGNKPGLEPFPGTRKRGEIYRQHAAKMAVKAFENLSTAIDPRLITHVITVSCTGLYAPGLDIDMVELLGLSPQVERTCINFMGCYGAFNALKFADYICKTNPQAKVLIVDVELCTLHFQRENTLDNWLANALFADGAAIVLVENSLNASSPNGLLLHTFYNTLLTDARDDMGWEVGDTGFEMKLSAKVPKKIKKSIHDVAQNLLMKGSINMADFKYFAVHPGGKGILDACEEALALPAEANRIAMDVLANYGNMSSATILFVLQQIMRQPDKGKVLSFAFGPGLTVESMILDKV